MENKIVFYSNTNNSKKIALYLSEYLGFEAADIRENTAYAFDGLVLVFPVHCQNIPKTVKAFLKQARANRVVLLATYGRMWHGNVLREIQARYRDLPIVGGAYIPCPHAYLPSDEPFTDYEKLRFVKECLQRGEEVAIERCFKNPFANFFPITRSRLGIRLRRTEGCNGCGVCKCEQKCIRCLRCVRICPRQAVAFRPTFFMRLYLRKKRVNTWRIYTKKR